MNNSIKKYKILSKQEELILEKNASLLYKDVIN
jgi:hypothetical protein